MNFWKFLAIALAILLGLSYVGFAYVYRQEPISILHLDPLWTSVFITVVLVGINAYYAWQTRQTIAEMERARKAEFMPHIKATLDYLGPVFLVLRVTNFGKGPAMEAKTTITFLPSKETRSWEQRIMSPGESIRILLPEGNIQKVCEKAEKILVKGVYSDIFKQAFEINEEIDTKDFMEKMTQLRQILEPDIPRVLKEISEELERIRHELSDIRSALKPKRSSPV